VTVGKFDLEILVYLHVLSPAKYENLVFIMLLVCLYLCTDVCLTSTVNGWMNFIHVWYSRFIHPRSVCSESEHSNQKNRGPSNGPQNPRYYSHS
jgi:hypothetical protein